MSANATLRKALLVALVCAFALILAAFSLPAAAQAEDGARTATGQLTVNASDGAATNLAAYHVFAADVADGAGHKIASNIEWANADAEAAVVAAIEAADDTYAGTTATQAAAWLEDKETADPAAFNAAVAGMAKNLLVSKAAATALTAGTTATLSQGYWLVASADSAVGVGQAATAPILALVGGSPAQATAKAAVPTVGKEVLEDSTSAWQKQADATVGDSLSWRLDATVPAGITGYRSYGVTFHDTLSAGLAEPSNVHVYVAAPAADDATAFWADGAEPGDEWTELDPFAFTTAYAAADDGATFDVTVDDLMQAMKDAGLDFAGGARVAVTYDAPLTSAAAVGTAEGNPNEVTLRYPKSQYSDAFAETQPQSAIAYTWALQLTKRDAANDAPLAGAVLRVTDDQGRHLAQDGTWTSDDATVTTDANGQISAAGVDSGTYTVEEVQAPEGYALASGVTPVELTVGLDPDHIVHAQIEAAVKAAAPLRADSFDAATGQVDVSLLDSATDTSEGGPIASLLPKTGDRFYGILVALVALAGAIALLAKRRGRGSSRS